MVEHSRRLYILQDRPRTCFRLIFTFETELGVCTTDLLSLLLLLLLPDNSHLFLHSFVSLITLLLRPVRGQAVWPGLDHKMTWAKNDFSCVRKDKSVSLSQGDSLPCLLTVDVPAVNTLLSAGVSLTDARGLAWVGSFCGWPARAWWYLVPATCSRMDGRRGRT